MPHPIPNIIEALQSRGWGMHPDALQAAIDIVSDRAGLIVDPGKVAAAVEAQSARAGTLRTPSRIVNGSLGDEIRGIGADVQVVCDPATKTDDGSPDDSGDVGSELYTLVSPNGKRSGPALAIVPVRGVLASKASLINGISSPRGMTFDRAARGYLAACANERVANGGRVLVDFDTPGGSVAGGDTFASAIRNSRARGIRPFAYAEMAASMGYWMAVQCEEIWGPPQAIVGSVGVYQVITDSSGVDRKGLRKVLVTSGSAKGAGADGAPLTAEQLAAVTQEVMDLAEAFASNVQQARGLDADRMAQVTTGAAFVGKRAVGLKLMDGVASFTEVVAALLDDIS